MSTVSHPFLLSFHSVCRSLSVASDDFDLDFNVNFEDEDNDLDLKVTVEPDDRSEGQRTRTEDFKVTAQLRDQSEGQSTDEVKDVETSHAPPASEGTCNAILYRVLSTTEVIDIHDPKDSLRMMMTIPCRLDLCFTIGALCLHN